MNSKSIQHVRCFKRKFWLTQSPRSECSIFDNAAIASGLTSAITNPLHDSVMQAVMGADVMMGNDPHCTRNGLRNTVNLLQKEKTEGNGREGVQE